MDRRSFLTAISAAFAGSIITPQLNGGGLLGDPYPSCLILQIDRGGELKIKSGELQFKHRISALDWSIKDGPLRGPLTFGHPKTDIHFDGETESGMVITIDGTTGVLSAAKATRVHFQWGRDRWTIGLGDSTICTYPNRALAASAKLRDHMAAIASVLVLPNEQVYRDFAAMEYDSPYPLPARLR